jgi:hypothetical protein
MGVDRDAILEVGLFVLGCRLRARVGGDVLLGGWVGGWRARWGGTDLDHASEARVRPS